MARSAAKYSRLVKAVLSLALPALIGAGSASATDIRVEARPGAIHEALHQAQKGDVLILEEGTHPGPVIIDRSIILTGEKGAVIDGLGIENTLKIVAPDVTVRNLKIINSGEDLAAQHSGIFVDREAHNAIIENNWLVDNLISIYLWGPKDGMVRNNKVHGRKDLRLNERGNGIQLWRSKGSVVENNEIRYGRDGIYVTTSEDNIFRGNNFTRTRFAIHYMYTHDSIVADNYSSGNHIGFALMNSDNLTVRNNVSVNDRDHGIALNYTNKSVIEGNITRKVGEKCIFIYNSNKNAFRHNRFEGCGIGVHFTAGSERNIMSGNAFIGNQTQVKYVGTKTLDWSENGRGNYWSDNAAFDMDGDGLADSAYRPNDMVDRVVWAYPSAKLLLNSPAIKVLRWAQSTFPAIRPGGVYDSAPLMKPVNPKINKNNLLMDVKEGPDNG